MTEARIPDFLASLIRTYVPIVVGSLVAWLADAGITIDGERLGDAATIVVLALVSAVYYAAVRLLERRWPRLGVLLGVPRAPTYEPEPAAVPAPDPVGTDDDADRDA